MSSAQPFATVLRQHRLAAGHSQESLAELAGLSRRGISDIERGLKQTPHRDTVERLADALALDAPKRAAFLAAARGQGAASASERARRASAAALPLVGRHEELGLLTACLSGATAPALYFAGEPGIGKSRLLLEATRLAEAHGWQVIAGGCARQSGEEPYEPLVSALARHISQLPPARQRVKLQGCAWLVRLLPELAEAHVVPAPSWALPPPQERRLMFQAVARYAANVAGPAGTLLVLDDLQWASADGLDLLATLLRDQTGEPARAPLRLIAAYRSTEVRPEDPLARLLTELREVDMATQTQLAPLSREDASALLDQVHARERRGPATLAGAQEIEATLPDDVRQEILGRAEGVPFYLVSTARAWFAAEAAAGMADGAPAWQVPWTVAQSIRSRVAALPARAGALLGVAAVIGRVVPAALLMSLVVPGGERTEEDEALAALEAARGARLLRERGSDFQFTHDLIHEVVLSDLSAVRRTVLHRRVAEAYVRLPDGERERHLAEIAQHYQEAGDDVAALPYAMLAGDRAAAVYAHAEAERLYTLAIALASESGDRGREAAARLKLGQDLMLPGRLDESRQMLEAALAEFEQIGNREGQAGSRLALAINLGYSARFEEALVHVVAVRDLIEPVAPPREVAQIYRWVSTGYLMISLHAEELAAAERALDYADRSEDAATIAQVRMRYGGALVWQGRIEEGCATIERYFSQAAQVCDPVDHGLVMWALMEGHIALGDYNNAHLYCDRCLEYERSIGHDLGMAASYWYIAILAFHEGEWDQAQASYAEAVRISREPRLWFHPGVLILSRYLGHLRGARELAAGSLAEALALAEQRSLLRHTWPCAAALADEELLEDRPEAAARRLAPLLDPLGDEPHLSALPLVPLLAQAYLEMGQVAEAAATARRAIERASQMKHRLVLVDALRVQAMIALQEREWAEAEQALEQALTLTRDIPYPYAEAKALYVSGQLHAAQGEPERAREAYQHALAICARLGERMYAERIERALAGV